MGKACERLVDDGFALCHSPSEFTRHYFSSQSLWWGERFNEPHPRWAHRAPSSVFLTHAFGNCLLSSALLPQLFFDSLLLSYLFKSNTPSFQLAWHVLPLTTTLPTRLFSLHSPCDLALPSGLAILSTFQIDMMTKLTWMRVHRQQSKSHYHHALCVMLPTQLWSQRRVFRVKSLSFVSAFAITTKHKSATYVSIGENDNVMCYFISQYFNFKGNVSNLWMKVTWQVYWFWCVTFCSSLWYNQQGACLGRHWWCLGVTTYFLLELLVSWQLLDGGKRGGREVEAERGQRPVAEHLRPFHVLSTAFAI